MEDHFEGSSGKNFSSQTLLGKRDDPLYNTYLKHLVEFFNSTIEINVVLCISLTTQGRDQICFQEIINFIKYSCKEW